MSSRRYCACVGLVPKTPKSAAAARANWRRLKALLVGLILLTAQRVAPADVVSLEPIDAQASAPDGNVWTIDPSTMTILAFRSIGSPSESRGVLEYSLADIPDDSVILSATIEFSPALLGSPPTPVIEFHGYGGDGVLEASDAMVPFNMIGQSPPLTTLDPVVVSLDPEYIESLLGVSSHLGIMTHQQMAGAGAAFFSVEAWFLAPPAIVTLEFDANPCPADFDADGFVGPADLAQVLGFWGENPGHPADLDGDGMIGPQDLAILLGNWGPC